MEQDKEALSKLEAHERECNVHRDYTRRTLDAINKRLDNFNNKFNALCIFFGTSTIGALIAFIIKNSSN